jgi:hypothetical protein
MADTSEEKPRTQAHGFIQVHKDAYNKLYAMTHDDDATTDFYGQFADVLNSTVPVSDEVSAVNDATYNAVAADICYKIFSRDPSASQVFFRNSGQRCLSHLVNGYTIGLMLGIVNNVYIKTPRFDVGTTEKYEVREKEVKPEDPSRPPRTTTAPRVKPVKATYANRVTGTVTTGSARTSGSAPVRTTGTRTARPAGATRPAGVVRRTVTTEEFVMDAKKTTRRKTQPAIATTPVGDWGDEPTIE